MVDEMIGYIYNLESLELVEEVSFETNEQTEEYFEENYDNENYGLTYRPAFGFEGGLK